MTVKTPSRKGQGDHWTDGGQDYSAYRPTYPAALADALAALSPEARLAVDAGLVIVEDAACEERQAQGREVGAVDHVEAARVFLARGLGQLQPERHVEIDRRP